MQEMSRRELITKILPGCTLLCLGGNISFARLISSKAGGFQGVHKFRQEYDRKLTLSQIWDFRYRRDFIPTMMLLKEYMEKGELLELLKRVATERNTQLGQYLAEKWKTNSFHALVDPFRIKGRTGKLGSLLQLSMTHEIVEDSEKVFEVRVTECLTADVFRESDAADIGFACVCYADYALPPAFNPKCKLVRDKTLMQGHDCCNHRYVFEG